MNNVIKLTCGVCLSAFLCTFLLSSEIYEQPLMEAKIFDLPEKDDDHFNYKDCDDFFCDCAPLIRATFNTLSFTPTESAPAIVIPFTSSIGFGGGFSLCKNPLIVSGQILAPAGRINICDCGWFRISFSANAIYNAEPPQNEQVQVLPARLFLRSPILGDIFLGSIFPTGTLAISVPLNATEVTYFTESPNSCSPPYYSLELTDVQLGRTVTFVNPRLIIQKVGPCKCCPRCKPCCPTCCDCTCKKSCDHK